MNYVFNPFYWLPWFLLIWWHARARKQSLTLRWWCLAGPLGFLVAALIVERRARSGVVVEPKPPELTAFQRREGASGS